MPEKINRIEVNGTEHEIDASTLGGNTPEYFANSSHNHDTKYAAKTHTHTTKEFTEPNNLNKVTVTSQGIIDSTSADRLAFLPAEQIIVEQSTDAGVTWTATSMTDIDKRNLFLSTDMYGNCKIPLKDGKKSCSCMVRITVTGMKYAVPDGTVETEKYNYWNKDYVNASTSAERYFNPNLCSIWIDANSDRMQCVIQRATGKDPNTWVTEGTYNTLSGWSGRNVLKLNGNVFGGSTTQTTNWWNYRFIFRTQASDGSFDDTKLSINVPGYAQTIANIRLYSSSCWISSNNLMRNGHLYSWNRSKDAIFPAVVTANNGFITGANIQPKANKSGSVGTADYQFASMRAVNFYEDGTRLADKYAPVSHTHDYAVAGLIVSEYDASTATLKLVSAPLGSTLSELNTLDIPVELPEDETPVVEIENNIDLTAINTDERVVIQGIVEDTEFIN